MKMQQNVKHNTCFSHIHSVLYRASLNIHANYLIHIIKPAHSVSRPNVSVYTNFSEIFYSDFLIKNS